MYIILKNIWRPNVAMYVIWLKTTINLFYLYRGFRILICISGFML